jgi:hypothetical protein
VTTASSSCPNCTAASVSQAGYIEPVPSAASTTTTPPSTYAVPQTTGSSSPASEPSPTLAPDANVAPERSQIETQKPAPADPPRNLPEAAGDTKDESANFQAPTLLDPNDRTAERHQAPVWTAVYHKVGGAAPAVQPISTSVAPGASMNQAERDAAGWSSASK